MIVPFLLADLSMVTPVSDSVWWNTAGGEVTEHRDATGARCSLMLYDDVGSVVFQWADATTTTVTAIDWSWQFPDDWPVPVAMQVGDVWLSNPEASVVLQAVGHGNAISFPMSRSINDLLTPVDHILVRITVGQLLIKLDPARVGTLLSHARQCTNAITR